MNTSRDPEVAYGTNLIWVSRGLMALVLGAMLSVPGALWDAKALLRFGLFMVGIGLVTIVLSRYVWDYE